MASTPSLPRRASPQIVILPLLCAVLQILTPLLPQLGMGEPIGDRSDDFRTLITPAGWAFSIWGALYAGSLVFAVYQALPAHRAEELLARVRLPASGAFLGNAVWALYTQSVGLTAISVLVILFTLACLVVAYIRLADWPRPFTTGQRWCVALPLSALAAWLTAAAIVNIAASLRYYGVEAGGAAPLIGAVVLIVGGIIASAAIYRGRGNPPYALVFLWALAAIYAAGGQDADTVAIGSIVAAGLVLGATWQSLRRGGMDHWFRQ